MRVGSMATLLSISVCTKICGYLAVEFTPMWNVGEHSLNDKSHLKINVRSTLEAERATTGEIDKNIWTLLFKSWLTCIKFRVQTDKRSVNFPSNTLSLLILHYFVQKGQRFMTLRNRTL